MGNYPVFDQRVVNWVKQVRDKVRTGIHAPDEFIALNHLLHDMRLYKSRQEIKAIRQAARISASAHKRAMYICEPGMMEYLEAIGNFPACRGHYHGKRYYQFDLFRFCRKSFAQHHAAENYDGKLFWLDADVVTHKPVPERVLEDTLKDVYMCYLGRTDWHSCASFIGWDTTHKMNRAFMQTYLNVYLSGDIFHQPEWHDSFIVDKVREGTEVPARNLTKDIVTEGPANIFDMSFLGEYAHHLKGQLKFQKKAS